jgi:hypothetical protein
MSASVVGAGVSTTDKQRGETREVGKHKRERNEKYENWRTLKAGRGGVYLRRSERSDKWRGGAFVRSRRLRGWLAFVFTLRSARSLHFLFARLFYRRAISHYIQTYIILILSLIIFVIHISHLSYINIAQR